jgi:hypothetical protein
MSCVHADTVTGVGEGAFDDGVIAESAIRRFYNRNP